MRQRESTAKLRQIYPRVQILACEFCPRESETWDELPGYSLANTTYRYANANVETAKRAAAALYAFNADTIEAETARTGALSSRQC